jgi:hypothetical protein
MSAFFPPCFGFCLCFLTLWDGFITRSKNPTECLRYPQFLSLFRIGTGKRGLVLSAEYDGDDDYDDDDDDDDDKCNPTL